MYGILYLKDLCLQNVFNIYIHIYIYIYLFLWFLSQNFSNKIDVVLWPSKESKAKHICCWAFCFGPILIELGIWMLTKENHHCYSSFIAIFKNLIVEHMQSVSHLFSQSHTQFLGLDMPLAPRNEPWSSCKPVRLSVFTLCPCF